MLHWFRDRRRRKLLSEPFPAEWEAVLRELSFYRLLTPVEQEQLQHDVRIFVAEKNWEGVHGLELTDAMRVRIAAHACYLILGLDLSCYDRTMSILVYPNAYSVPEQFAIAGGGVIEGRSQRLGENWYRGPIILSWPDVLAAGSEGARTGNLVYHEFAHELDTLNGRNVDGRPVLDAPDLARRWEPVMSRAYERLCIDCQYGRPTLLDCYGTKNRGEFFAVATEVFFQQPVRMLRREQEVYELFAQYYRQDPAARILRQTSPVHPAAGD
jgi:Mlc titration factor MtfA (ptsG expression regulator)